MTRFSWANKTAAKGFKRDRERTFHCRRKETGVIIQVQNLKAGKYRIYLMNKNNNKVDTSCKYTFKRVKEKFELESIRVLKWQKFVNLVALIQLAVLVSTIMFLKIQQSTNSLIIGVLLYYKKYLKLKTLGFNIDSFITFMKSALKPLVFRFEKPPNQLKNRVLLSK